MKNLTILLLIIFSTQTYAQVNDVYVNPETPNGFIGGDDAVMTYLDKHFDFCKDIKGRESIIIQFVIEPDSTYSNLIFISKNTEATQLMIKDMLNSLPKWIPGAVKRGER